jgi:ABC-type sugar transport system substrate-binding protein
MSRRVAAFAAASVVMLALLGAPAGAHAATAGTFTCQVSATKLGARIEVTFRLRSSDAAREWRVRMWNAAVKFADRTPITNHLGRLRVVATTKNRQGKDQILGIARDLETGLRCRVELSI